MNESPPAPPRTSRWWKRLLLAGVSLVFTLALLEGAARVLHLGSGGFWEPDREYGWRNIPGARGWESCYGECEVYVEINSKGLRDYEYAYEKPPGVHRMVFLGDSMTAALQVPLEQTFVKLLESNLNAGTEAEWEVVNASVNAFGTDNELLFYRGEASRYGPDLVVLSVYLANDIYNNHYQLETRLGGSGHKPYFTLDEAGHLVLNNYPVEDAETFSTRFFGFLNRSFQLPRFAAQTLNLRRSVPEALRPLIALATGSRGAQQVAGQGQAEGPASRVNICQQDYAPVIAEAWDITKGVIRELRREVEADGAHLVVIALPAAPQLVVPKEDRGWYCEQPNLELAAFLQSEGIEFFDLLYPFREYALAGGERLYFQTDFHLNAAGHALAGAALTEFFQEEYDGFFMDP